MTQYITPAQLSVGSGAERELGQLFDLTPPLWQLTLVDGDRSAFSPAEIEAADAALVAVTRSCEEAAAEVDSYLSQRGYLLPLDVLMFPVLLVWSRALARYHAHRQRERTTEESGRVERDYRDAKRALEMVAAGRLSLGGNDPLAAGVTVDADDPDGAIRVTSNPRLFSRSTLADL